ncbi:hypothetical protein GALMADRAFT_1124826 [Galerina marginata CBS 339.88]|uniref:Uncharacterized protein n=1 Tax=Galerina marginata (strain CBS 339.88) TaxID=685588 RepID=A0A067TQJ6_GALM3|nr:hypothetical protein GALMADRAFT_1124826 [Galerina marginata CBS 339.88]
MNTNVIVNSTDTPKQDATTNTTTTTFVLLSPHRNPPALGPRPRYKKTRIYAPLRLRTLSHRRPLPPSTQPPYSRTSRWGTTTSLPMNVGHLEGTNDLSPLVERRLSSRPSSSSSSHRRRLGELRKHGPSRCCTTPASSSFSLPPSVLLKKHT